MTSEKTDSLPDETPAFSGDMVQTAAPLPGTDHIRREVAIPMRDGIKLHTVLMIPKGAVNAPVMLERTPYNASKLTRLSGSQRSDMLMHAFHAELLKAGYIVALQDVRGKFKSEGVYVLNRPVRGPLNGDETDHVTDAWDTVDWLSREVPEGNGKIATIGISYDGFTTLMSLLDAHPALKAAVPINPMTDCWTGDDWFHNGAFRQTEALRYIYQQTMSKTSDVPWPFTFPDEYEAWLTAGNAAGMARRAGMDQLPAWQRVVRHTAFDDYWQGQALDRLLAQCEVSVPTLHVYSRFDAEDTYGAMGAYLAMQTRDQTNGNFIAIGPWSHPGVGFGKGDRIGAMSLGSDTASWFRRKVMLPFLDRHMKTEPPPEPIARVTAFETGSNEWHTYSSWPPAASDGFEAAIRPLFLRAGSGLAFTPPQGPDGGADTFISDPAKPVTYLPRPVATRTLPGSGWDDWLVSDQRFAGDRPDVLRYVSPVLDAPLRLAGQPVAEFWAATTGSDADWVVKLIDVYPEEYAPAPAMAGYQMPLSMDILRARFRDDPSVARPVPANEPVRYTLPLPHVSHMMRPGHRLMIQIQCSWFPLYDRNPQRFVDNIMEAGPEDYIPATQTVFRGGDMCSRILLPVLQPA